MSLEEVTIGGYRRINVLQTGQNSEVWEVSDGNERFRYAMKLLLPERATDSEQRRALQFEATLGMQLKHPKIIRTHKFVKDKDGTFILMEYFPSLNLKLRMQRRGQWEEFLRPHFRHIMEQVCGALQFLHDQKWVHRDVKPENVLVNGAAEVRLIDFALAVRAATGLAKLFWRRGKTAGTRSYMSPEQIRGLPLDCRADIYSFGVMLYELCSGRLPFVASTANDLLRKHLQSKVAPLESTRGVTPKFEALIIRMLAKKAGDRPASVNEVLSEMRGMKLFVDEEEEPTAP